MKSSLVSGVLYRSNALAIKIASSFDLSFNNVTVSPPCHLSCWTIVFEFIVYFLYTPDGVNIGLVKMFIAKRIILIPAAPYECIEFLLSRSHGYVLT